MQPITVAAQVIWWDADTIFAHYLCPFCEESHARSFPFDASAYQTTQSPPEQMAIAENPPLRFKFEFPFSFKDGTSWYEIEKESARFVAIGRGEIFAKLRARIPSTPADLTTSLERLAIVDGAQKSSDAAEEQKCDAACDEVQASESERGGEIDRVLEAMRRGDCRYLKRYLETPGKPKSFLYSDIKSRDYALGLAAQQSHPNIVQLLLKNGADVNKGDKDNVNTPLIWAVRTLNYDNVWHLLNHGADENARTIPWGLMAMDEANSLIEGDPSLLELIKAPTSRKARKLKGHLLVNDGGQITMPNPRESPEDYAFEIQSQGNFQRQIRLSKIVSDFYSHNTSKTIAVLKRPGICPDVAAMSGWKHEHYFTKDMLKLRGSWTEVALQTGRAIGYEFPPSPDKDQGKPGQYNACHAEAKLIAFMVSKHAFLPSEIVKGEELHELVNVAPSAKSMQAEILVDNEPCESCKGFREAVKAHCGLNIVLLKRLLV